MSEDDLGIETKKAKIREQNRVYQARYRAKYPKKYREYNKKYRLEHLDKIRESSRKSNRKYRAKNREKMNTYLRKWRANNADRHKEVAWKSHLKRTYGMTPEQYDKMLEACGNICPICQRSFSKRRRPIVDHCHESGLTRGVICFNCNAAEGHLGSPKAALRLYDYMRSAELFYQGKN